MTARQEMEARLIERARGDAAFKELLLADPRQAVESELGFRLPPDLEVKVLEETPRTLYLVYPLEQGELSERELNTVAGGGDWFSNHSSTC